VRNCLVALSEEERLLADLFQHRYGGGGDLDGHSLGNLILAALAEQTGSFLKAVEMSSHVLRIAGRILPVTLEDVTLVAHIEDGTTLAGESAIGRCRQRIDRVGLRPASARATPGVVDALADADLIVLGPGSLFTSVLPTIVLDEVARAIRGSRAVRVLVGNLVSERGDDAGLALADHVRIVEHHAGAPVVDALLAHDGPIGGDVLERYRAEGAVALEAPAGDMIGVRVVRRALLARGPKLRHDPERTAEGLVLAWAACRTRRPAAAVRRTIDRGREAVS
jgi:uncharacterized cofD-like protein